MYIQDEVVYAGEQKPLVKVVSAKPLDGYRLRVRFGSGEIKIFDFTPLLDEPAFKPLKDKKLFSEVYVEYGVPSWKDGEIDIAPDYLFENAVIAD